MKEEESEHGIPEKSEVFMVLDQCSHEDRQLIMFKHYFGFSYQEIFDLKMITS
ncbi:hypothetical protein RZN25_10500 [Bacillaceae bacterium S4-13-56]